MNSLDNIWKNVTKVLTTYKKENKRNKSVYNKQNRMQHNINCITVCTSKTY